MQCVHVIVIVCRYISEPLESTFPLRPIRLLPIFSVTLFHDYELEIQLDPFTSAVPLAKGCRQLT